MGILDAPAATRAQVSTATRGALKRTPSPMRRNGVKAWAQCGSAGHGWAVASGYTSASINDTSDYLLGTQAAKVVTGTSSNEARLTKTGVAMDFTGANVRVVFKYAAATDFLKIIVRLGDSGLTNKAELTLIDLTSSPNGRGLPEIPGDWNVIDIPWSAFTTTGTPNRASIDTIQIGLYSRYGIAATTFFNGAGAVYEDQDGDLPNGGLIITMDDTRLGQSTLAIPYLDLFGIRTTLYPVLGSTATGSTLSTRPYWRSTRSLTTRSDRTRHRSRCMN